MTFFLKSKDPETLDEAIEVIVNAMSSSKDYSWILKASEDDVLVQTHHGYGRTIRNQWGLWQDSLLKKNLEKIGFTHPDDMSSSLIKFALRDIKNQPRLVDEEIQKHKEYWAKQKGLK